MPLLAAVAAVLIIIVGITLLIVFSSKSNNEKAEQIQAQEQQIRELQDVLEVDKLEMKNQYEDFARQYNELKTQINNDSLIAQLELEQQRTQELLAELERTRSSDAAEIMRLKKELATMREVLKSFVAEIDSLNRVNAQLTQENTNLREQQQVQQQQISNLSSRNESLSGQVAIAAQLNATNISIIAKNRKGKAAKKVADVKQFQISFNIARNVTASTGMRTVYIRILKPTGELAGGGHGTFAFENRQLEYTIRKDGVEFDGEDTPVTMYWEVNEMLVAGNYRIQIFVDGNEIGSDNVNFEK